MEEARFSFRFDSTPRRVGNQEFIEDLSLTCCLRISKELITTLLENVSNKSRDTLNIFRPYFVLDSITDLKSRDRVPIKSASFVNDSDRVENAGFCGVVLSPCESSGTLL